MMVPGQQGGVQHRQQARVQDAAWAGVSRGAREEAQDAVSDRRQQEVRAGGQGGLPERAPPGVHHQVRRGVRQQAEAEVP